MRNWNLRLGRVAGIPIEIHWTFWLILIYVFYGDFSKTGDTKAALAGVVTVLGIFTCVVLHELGHALMALRFGVKTRDIIWDVISGRGGVVAHTLSIRPLPPQSLPPT